MGKSELKPTKRGFLSKMFNFGKSSTQTNHGNSSPKGSRGILGRVKGVSSNKIKSSEYPSLKPTSKKHSKDRSGKSQNFSEKELEEEWARTQERTKEEIEPVSLSEEQSLFDMYKISFVDSNLQDSNADSGEETESSWDEEKISDNKSRKASSKASKQIKRSEYIRRKQAPKLPTLDRKLGKNRQDEADDQESSKITSSTTMLLAPIESQGDESPYVPNPALLSSSKTNPEPLCDSLSGFSDQDCLEGSIHLKNRKKYIDILSRVHNRDTANIIHNLSIRFNEKKQQYEEIEQDVPSSFLFSGKPPSFSFHMYVCRLIRYMNKSVHEEEYMYSYGIKHILMASLFIEDLLEKREDIFWEEHNMHRILAAATLVAMKNSDDAQYMRITTSLWAKITGILKGEILSLERNFFDLLVDNEENFLKIDLDALDALFDELYEKKLNFLK